VALDDALSCAESEWLQETDRLPLEEMVAVPLCEFDTEGVEEGLQLEVVV
jgi:hypothetical protein